LNVENEKMRRYTGEGSFGSVEKKENKTPLKLVPGARPAYKDSLLRLLADATKTPRRSCL